MNLREQSNEALIWYHHDELLLLHRGEVPFGKLFTKNAQDSLNKYGIVESIRLNGLKVKRLTEYARDVMGLE